MMQFEDVLPPLDLSAAEVTQEDIEAAVQAWKASPPEAEFAEILLATPES